jgi:hypothetical protein
MIAVGWRQIRAPIVLQWRVHSSLSVAYEQFQEKLQSVSVLVGPKGDDGEPGEPGPQGNPGVTNVVYEGVPEILDGGSF